MTKSWTRDEIAYLKQELSAGKSIAAISCGLERSLWSVKQKMWRMRAQSEHIWVRRVPSIIWSPEEIEIVRKGVAAGRSTKLIARYDLANKRTWFGVRWIKRRQGILSRKPRS
jgi:hypothetical protein